MRKYALSKNKAIFYVLLYVTEDNSEIDQYHSWFFTVYIWGGGGWNRKKEGEITSEVEISQIPHLGEI